MGPIASVSLDLDNLWSYLKTHGDHDWEQRPTYLPLFVPRVLQALDELGLTITFFVVGVDAERDENAAALAGLPAAGHEIGNHSHEHEPWLHRYTTEELDRELERAERAIVAATGQHPRGFRGPGFSWSPELLTVLARRGYRYDASTLPTFLGPLARAYYFRTAKLSREEREERAELFGTLGEGFRPLAPYRWDLPDGLNLVEIPVTTAPILRVPFHLSYVLYLCRWSEGLAMTYIRTVLAMCRVAGLGPSFLLHPLDLLTGDDVPSLRFFPGMDLPRETKTRVFHRVLTLLKSHFDLVPMNRHAESALSGNIRRVAPAAAA